MHYFIDGYNLLFRLVHSSDELQIQRESFIYDLNQKVSLLKLDVSIVFDSTFQIGERSRSHYDRLEILYSAQGETADEYILDEIKHAPHPQQETVVTSDKNLAWLARHCAAHTQSVEDFILWLNRAYKNKLRQSKEEMKSPSEGKRPSSPSLTASPSRSPIATPRPLIPPQDAPLEAYAEYYALVFESEWQEIIRKEEQVRNEKSSSASSLKRPPRKPRRPRDPFQPPQTPEQKEATEMERWLKAFEKRLSDSNEKDMHK